MNHAPLGLFITWTVYGTHLPGDSRGWRHRNTGPQTSCPSLENWHLDGLQHDVITLNKSMHEVTEEAIREICVLRNWSLWAVAVRSNHVHVVVTAPEYAPELVRDQLKAKATRKLREAFQLLVNRPVWSAKGDIEFLDSENDIEQYIVYVNEAQDRKDRDHIREPRAVRPRVEED